MPTSEKQRRERLERSIGRPANKKYTRIGVQIALGEYKQSPGFKKNPNHRGLELGDYLERIPPDAHEETLRLPETVVILGSGKNAVQGLRLIRDDFVIALNRAVMMRDCDIWMCATAVYIHHPWFKEAIAKPCVKVFGTSTAVIFNADFSYTSLPQFCQEPVGEWIEGVYRGASVAGSALNMCRDKGVKHVRFCGVDMFGQEYWDGGLNRWDLKKDSVWTERDSLQAMIELCKSEGMRITSLSDTALEVERES